MTTPTVNHNSSKVAVRTCSEDCPFIRFKTRGEAIGCEYYIAKEVKFGEPCLYDLKTIEGFVEAYKNGNLNFVKESVGAITGSMVVKINEMLATISEEGMTYLEPILDGKGNPILIDGKIATRIVEHPLLSKIVATAKAIGFDLQKFNLTASTSGEKPSVVGNIMLNNNPTSLEDAVRRNEDAMKRFADGAVVATQKLEADPVYRSIKGGKSEG